MQFKLEKETHKYWQKNFYDPSNPISENMQFKLYVETELEIRINDLPDLGYDPIDTRKYKKRVASATFAYEN